MPGLIRHPEVWNFGKQLDSGSVIPDLIRDRNDENIGRWRFANCDTVWKVKIQLNDFII